MANKELPPYGPDAQGIEYVNRIRELKEYTPRLRGIIDRLKAEGRWESAMEAVTCRDCPGRRGDHASPCCNRGPLTLESKLLMYQMNPTFFYATYRIKRHLI